MSRFAVFREPLSTMLRPNVVDVTEMYLFQSLLRVRGKKTRAQVGQSVSRVRRTGARAARHGHRELREQGHDGELRVQGQHRLKPLARSSLRDNGFRPRARTTDHRNERRKEAKRKQKKRYIDKNRKRFLDENKRLLDNVATMKQTDRY